MTNNVQDQIYHAVETAIREGVSVNDFVSLCHQCWVDALHDHLMACKKEWGKIRDAMIG
jgi:hypothetical protein